MKGISGHADMNGLLDWIRGFEKIPDRVMVVHGEDTVTDHFAKLVEDTFGCPAFAPYSGGTVDLAANEIITIGQKIPKNQMRNRVSLRVHPHLIVWWQLQSVC